MEKHIEFDQIFCWITNNSLIYRNWFIIVIVVVVVVVFIFAAFEKKKSSMMRIVRAQSSIDKRKEKNQMKRYRCVDKRGKKYEQKKLEDWNHLLSFSDRVMR